MKMRIAVVMLCGAACTPPIDLGKSFCTTGDDHSCNLDPAVQKPLGACSPGRACDCFPGYRAENGRCALLFACQVSTDCGPGGTCESDGSCSCKTGDVLGPDGKCTVDPDAGTCLLGHHESCSTNSLDD